jgi:hypothetical protein
MVSSLAMQFGGLVDPSALVLAYLDPGTGSVLLQLLLAGVLSGMVFFKTAVSRVRLLAWRALRR